MAVVLVVMEIGLFYYVIGLRASASGSLIFSGVIAMGIWNFYADEQATLNWKTSRFVALLQGMRVDDMELANCDKAAPAPASHYPPSGVLEPVVRHRRRGCEEEAAAVREKCSQIIQKSKKARSGSVGMPADVKSLETEGIKKSRVGKGGMNKKVTEDASQVSFANCRRLSTAKKEIFEKLGVCSSEKEPTDGLNSSQGKVKQKYHEEQKAPANGTKTAAVKHRKPVDRIGRVYIKKTSCAISNVESESENFVVKQTIVADPEFHDFENDRTEVSFADNKVWATYDGDDRMPRYYALIHNVITLRPFKVSISWLSSKGNQKLGPMWWVGSGFAKTCGDLWIGDSIVYGSLNAFSHVMRWKKSSRGLIQIYPLKGDVWALYRNWSSDWNESTPNDVKHSYDMVEVIEDSSKEHGVTVAPLIKVCGLKTLFGKHPDPCKLWTIPREELFRFSHQVPAQLITGEEGANAPIGCWELDPASTPLELQVSTQGQGGDMDRPAGALVC
ncbi:uncharacterized protein LOC115741587 [Rhodamnia argentea]|uniref:Uncharacterized protein LOC115741587 n=1 Tax=Rhodamnia argentea TaxID=178133 RepID=A0ABM3HJ31_9MYRT|nr:uncharacterized protein LOC115741587 [Rhodamnia argentea]